MERSDALDHVRRLGLLGRRGGGRRAVAPLARHGGDGGGRVHVAEAGGQRVDAIELRRGGKK